MNQPENTRSYDLFKAIVALILLIILIWLLLRGAPSPVPVAVAPATTNPPPSLPQVNPTVPPSATSEPLQPSAIPIVEPTETSIPTPTPTEALTIEQSPTAALTAPPQPAATSQPTATSSASEAPAQISVDCPLALPARLKVGDTARVMAHLNMRSSAGIGSQLILTNPTGTELAIIGGPVCEPYRSRAYLWWQVRRTDGQSGWSAEGSLTGKFYFLEPKTP